MESDTTNSGDAKPDTWPLVDAAGARHQPAGAGPRIVSLVPSLTELLFDLGLGARLVGRTHYCVHPRGEVEKVTSVGGTKKVKLDRLRALGPSHVIVNVDENSREQVDEIAGFVPHVIVTHPLVPADNIALYRLIGGLFGRDEAAARLCRDFTAARAALEERARALPRRRVLYLVWKEPWMTVSRDTYLSRTLALANWETVAHDPGLRYPVVEIGAELLAATDLVLFPSEPYAFTAADIEAFGAAHPGGPRLSAIDGEMVSWYGSRAIEGLGYLGELATGLA